MNTARKIVYLSITGILSSIAISACYWQTNRYLSAKQRWQVISRQLSEQNPINITKLTQQQKQNLFPYKYLQIDGQLSNQKMCIERPKGLRKGYIVLRKLEYKDQGESKYIVALEGWCPEGYQLVEKIYQNGKQVKTFKGILRKKQAIDSFHKKLQESSVNIANYDILNTWINLQNLMVFFKMTPDKINSNFYFQLLKPMISQTSQLSKESHNCEQESYPYQYSVDNFELPYLTPDKHRGYAMFWGCSAIVGLMGMIKVFK